MTISQLFTRMCRRLAKLPGDMAAADQQDLVDAANKGLAEFCELLPAVRRTERKSLRLAAPVTHPITVTALSASITFTPPWTEQAQNLGRTVVVGGDTSRPNRLEALNTLLSAHEGSTGSSTLQVMSDAVLMGPFEDAVAGEISLIRPDGNSALLNFGRPDGMREDEARRIQPGVPAYWWVEPFNGLSGGDAPQFIIRLWPQPEQACAIHYDRRLWTAALTVAQLASTAVLPVKPSEEGWLVDMCKYGMVSSPLWVGTANKEDAKAEYDRALAAMGRREAQSGHTKHNRVKLARGF